MAVQNEQTWLNLDFFVMFNSTEDRVSTAPKTKMLKSKDFYWFQDIMCRIHHANKCKNANT